MPLPLTRGVLSLAAPQLPLLPLPGFGTTPPATFSGQGAHRALLSSLGVHLLLWFPYTLLLHEQSP